MRRDWPAKRADDGSPQPMIEGAYGPRPSSSPISDFGRNAGCETMSLEPRPLTARRSDALAGHAQVPGDKSISIRALILGALAVGETRIAGMLEGEDALNTAKAMQALGANVVRTGERQWRVHGVGISGFAEPRGPLDFGNSGTGCRLAPGA